MIKLIRLFGLFVIICLIYGLGSAFNGEESSKNVDIPKQQSTEIVDNYNLEDYVSTNYVDENSNYQIQNQNDVTIKQSEEKDTINEKIETKLFDEDVSLKEKDEENIKESNEIIKEESNETIKDYEVKEVTNNSSDEVDNSSNDNTKTGDEIIDKELEIDTEIEELPKEKDIPEVDEEYERLKKLYKYKTGTECYYASLKAYSQTYQENYENAGCISGAYKGEFLGYRIIIYFVDGTSMYYDEAI